MVISKASGGAVSAVAVCLDKTSLEEQSLPQDNMLSWIVLQLTRFLKSLASPLNGIRARRKPRRAFDAPILTI